MIRFTDGKKEYIWTDDDEIIGMDEMDTEILKKRIEIEFRINHGLLPNDFFEKEGFTILEQDIEPDDAIY